MAPERTDGASSLSRMDAKPQQEPSRSISIRKPGASMPETPQRLLVNEELEIRRTRFGEIMSPFDSFQTALDD